MCRGFCTGHYKQLTDGRELQPLIRKGLSLIRDAEGRKLCRTCGEWKLEIQFGPHRKALDGVCSVCGECRRKDYAANKAHVRAVQYRYKYGIPLERRDAILLAQGGKCATCRTSDPGQKGWQTDHDHSCCADVGTSCGKCIRGVVCGRCNTALGLVHDNTVTLMNMITYLEKGATCG